MDKSFVRSQINNANKALDIVKNTYEAYRRDKLVFIKASCYEINGIKRISKNTINMFEADYKNNLNHLWKYSNKLSGYYMKIIKKDSANKEIADIIVKLFKIIVGTDYSDKNQMIMTRVKNIALGHYNK